EKQYDASSIEVLEGLEGVRLRPGMYIGTTGSKGLHHILWEIVDNAVDEAANGYASVVDITLNSDGSAKVSDNGRGIPIGIHPIHKVPAIQLVFTQLHAGGKFNNENYKTSGGLHGVGASVTNALSDWLIAQVFIDKKKYTMKFHTYADKNGKIHSGEVDGELIVEACKEKRTGSEITFMPDKRIFLECEFDTETVENRLRELAFLNKGITFNFEDKRFDKKESFVYNGGIVDYVTYLDENKEKIITPIYIEAENVEQHIKVELAFEYTDTYAENTFSYVNNIPTNEGGTHETGFKSALTKVLNDFARTAKLIKEKEENLIGEDYREGLTAVLSVKLRNAQFEGQTKTKLGNPEVKQAVESLVTEGLTKFFAIKKKIGEIILKKALIAGKARKEASLAKEITRAKNSIDNSNLVGKLSSCTGKDYSKNELYIVEGDSAGGSAKQARDRKFQAILPLKGKPLNTEKKRLKAILENDEIRSIITALGTSIGDNFDISLLKYDKIIILSDADQDGAHIRAILLTFFFRYMRELLVDGHVYIGMPPLYKVFKKDMILYCYDDIELPSAMEKVGKTASLQRYKGLGEMNPEQLWSTTLNPATRSLMQVTLDDAAAAERITTILMGDSADVRKDYIILHADFNKDKDATLEKYIK
ncbi:MAG: DNA gyrase subunit B, partial [Clostridia bacterium]